MKAQIRTENISLKTYPFFDAAPVPEFGRLYPYNRFDGYSSQGTDQAWEMVVMENDFIKLWINPAVGGKIWGAIEKSTGKEFIYFNHVVKFRDVAMRGPWTSGGLENNIGIIGHSPSCSAPVDYFTRENTDGSVSCFLGATDWPSRTRWMVEVHLDPEALFFETRTSWFNNSPLEQAYYSWSNAGIKTTGELQYIFPGHKHLGHDGSAHDWPVDDQGRDLSFYNNNDFGHYKSYHVAGAYNDFWGCYWHADRFGMAHYADYQDKPGKKIWIWGLSRYGMLWEDLLTDNDGQYTEVQSGRMYNQSISSSSKTPFKHRAFPPYTADRWSECWFPVPGMNGLTFTCPEVSFFYNSKACALQVTANKTLQGRVRIEDGKHVLQEPVQLQALQGFTVTLPADFNAEALKLSFNGHLLYDAVEQQTVLQRPFEISKDFDHQSVQGLYYQGREWERQRFFDWAIAKYEASLALDPNFIPALNALAGLHTRSMLYGPAQVLLLRVLSIDAYDAPANYLYGLVCQQLAKPADAKEAFAIAGLSPAHRGAACTELAKMLISEQQYVKAIACLEKALAATNDNRHALHLLAIAWRKKHEASQAQTVLQQLLLTDPLDHLARFELQLLHASASANRWNEQVNGELAYETYIELAAFYQSIQCLQEAITILSSAAPQAMVLCWKAWLYAQAGMDAPAEECLSAALALSPEFVFPFRAEDANALQWARTRRNSWLLDYYLALVYLQLMRWEEARALLSACGNAPDFYPFYLVRARQVPETTASDLAYAVSHAPDEWRPALQQSKFYEELEQWPAATAAVEALYRQHPGNYYLGLQLAKCFLKTGRFAEGISLLESLVVLPNEGASEGRNVWRETNLLAAIDAIVAKEWNQALAFIAAARTWPENLGVGKPFDVDERLEDFLVYYCSIFIHEKDTAIYADRIMSFRDAQTPFAYGSNDFFTIYLSALNGKPTGGLLEAWKLQCKDPLPLRWVEAFLDNDLGMMQQLEQARQQAPIALPYEIPYVDREFFFVKMLYKLNILEPVIRNK